MQLEQIKGLIAASEKRIETAKVSEVHFLQQYFQHLFLEAAKALPALQRVDFGNGGIYYTGDDESVKVYSREHESYEYASISNVMFEMAIYDDVESYLEQNPYVVADSKAVPKLWDLMVALDAFEESEFAGLLAPLEVNPEADTTLILTDDQKTELLQNYIVEEESTLDTIIENTVSIFSTYSNSPSYNMFRSAIDRYHRDLTAAGIKGNWSG